MFLALTAEVVEAVAVRVLLSLPAGDVLIVMTLQVKICILDPTAALVLWTPLGLPSVDNK